MNLDHINANKALVRGVIEEVWNRDVSVIPPREVRELLEKFYAPNAVIHYGGNVQDVTTLANLVIEIRKAFPDFSDTIEDQVAEENTVATRITSAGTQREVFRGIQPTEPNKWASWMVIGIDRIEEGKIIEEWVSADIFRLAKQLGAELVKP